jgi:hypothetical protein
VDRKTAVLTATRAVGGVDGALATVQLGVGDDHGERARLSHGLFHGASFRPNRGTRDGRYALGTVELELHPNVTGAFVQPGFGARLHYEGARGDLTWQRFELGLSARKYWGPLSFAAHADGGLVTAAVLPPQTLFELGGIETLPGYDYKEFAGDRAGLLQAFASLRFPVWRAPVRIFRNLYIPGLGPGLGVGVQGGWTELSSQAAQQAVAELGAGWSAVPVSRATEGIRATVGAGITLFSDILHVGFARPVDRPAPWRFVFGVGQSF